MYEKRFVRKRKRKIAAAIIGSVCSITTAALILVAFLGRYSGTFTVTLDENNVNLSLSQTEDFKESTTMLNVNYLPQYHEATYSDIIRDEDKIDSEETDYLYGGNPYVDDDGVVHEDQTESLNFFKYTFYVKNTGTVKARYNFFINILENTPDTATGSRYLDDVVRVAVYENIPGQERTKPTVYAKSSTRPNRDDNGNVIYNEYISVPAERADEDNVCYGFAKEFEAKDRVATLRVKDFGPNDIKRYTIITWLEGEDPESDNNKLAPKGAKLKIGVEINAYENE